jgi:xanthine dehydrogenase/oxidase
LLAHFLKTEVIDMFSSINIKVRRLGGGYGGKITRSALISTACALAAHKLHRPVRLVMNLETNMAAIGKRCNAAFDYEVSDDKVPL